MAIELIVAGVSFVERNEGSDRASDEQVVSGIVVVSRVADEGGERQFRIELWGAIESLHAVDAVMVLGLNGEDEDREIKGRRGGGQFIESVAVNIGFTIRVPSPGGEAVGVKAGAIATIDALFVAIAEFAPHSAGSGFEFSAVASQINRPGRRKQTQVVRAKNDGFEQEIETQRRESRQGLVEVVESL